jgi:hypothetical protein
LHQPLDYFQANTFWPLRNSLAFSDALVGYAPTGMVGEGVQAAIVRYNLLFLFAYALAFVGAYLLARELGVGRAGAAVAGAAFAYAPWRLEQDGHMHVLSSGGIPLSLFMLLRGYRQQRPGLVLAGWLVATWQLSLGFTLGLQLAYLLAALAVLAGVILLRRRPRPPVARSLVAATATGAVLFLVVAGLLARPYLEVRDDHPESKRTTTQLAGLSPPLKSFIAAPEENLVWGKATAGVRDRLSSVPEQTLFPGVAILVLAAVGLAAPVYARPVRAGLALAVMILFVLSLGFSESGSPLLHPYRLLYDYAPGWQAIRAPGRLQTLTSLGLALLAAAGAHQAVSAVGRRVGDSRSAALCTSAAGLLLIGAILIEGSGFDLGKDGDAVAGPSHPAVPLEPFGQAGVLAPQFHLPPTVSGNRRYVLWSTDGFPAIVNGRGSFGPRSFASLVGQMQAFPDRVAVAVLRSMGVRTVVLHPSLANGTPWERSADRPVVGLGLKREPRGEVVLFHIAPR